MPWYDKKPAVGEVYDLEFPRSRVPIGVVRVRVVAADEETDPTPCGAETIPLQIISGRLPRNVKGECVWQGPGEFTTMALFIPIWTLVDETPS